MATKTYDLSGTDIRFWGFETTTDSAANNAITDFKLLSYDSVQYVTL